MGPERVETSVAHFDGVEDLDEEGGVIGCSGDGTGVECALGVRRLYVLSWWSLARWCGRRKKVCGRGGRV